MRNILWLIFITLLLCSTTSYSEDVDTIYTWRDKAGNLHITDYAPPDDAEILEMAPRIQVEKPVITDDTASQTERNKEALINRALALREEEKTERLRAKELLAKANMYRSRKATSKRKRRYRRKAQAFEKEAELALQKAEALAVEAAELEKATY